MSKKLKDLKWEAVALDGFPASVTGNLHGFVGLEECSNYGLDKEIKRGKKKKLEKPKKRKITQEIDSKRVTSKKLKLSNGFIVETCNSVSPSITNQTETQQKEIKVQNKKFQKARKSLSNSRQEENKKSKPKLGEDITQNVSSLTAEDMLMWAEFKLPEPIMKALTELGFKTPTKIQQLSLPAAIHGRRDILGAAETGSGKTLAFGLPILLGIMKLKEKAQLKGLDVYDIPYKKTSARKKDKDTSEPVNKKQKESKEKKVMSKAKESSEDGYSSDNEIVKPVQRNKLEKQNKAIKYVQNNDFIEEIIVPIKKKEKEPLTDEGNVSDDSDNYIHLSDMLDSDDLVDNSNGDDSDASDNELNMNAGNGVDSENGDNEVSDSQVNVSEEEDTGIVTGLGCVKVVDNIEIPGHVVTKTGKPLYALILTPTRELALQISRHLIAAGKYTGIKVATIVGGMAAVKQERVLRSGPEVVVATPGRLWELILQGQPHLNQLETVKFLAIDETDRMIERGHFEELHPLLERLNADDEKKSARQNFVFSATLTMVHDLPAHMRGKKVTKRGKILNRKIEKMTPQQKIKRLIDMIGMTDPKVVDITAHNLGTAETLTESRIACALEHKDAYLYYILKRHPGRTIVFCNSIGSVRRLAQLFHLLQCRPLPLHASMPQRQRLKNLERFRDDPQGVLIATDVAARGLDIPDVDHVVHYQVPRTAENYVHRSGRTARANKQGLTILMMDPSEAYLYAKLCRTLNKTSEVPTFPVSSQSVSSVKELVSVARELDTLELKKRRATQAQGWKEKAAREMDMIIDDDDLPVKEVDPSLEKALQAKKRQLQAMMTRPLFPKGFSFIYPTLNDPMALVHTEENALQVMKKALESGELKKEKRKGKNAPLLKLEKTLKQKK